MNTHTRVVVIGGGVVGCSVLYHLARAGWTDVTLIERSELTSGSSWHAAGGFHTLNGDPNVAKLQAYTVSLYDEIEKLSGQSCGLHLTGGVMLADSEERMDFLRYTHATGRALGMSTELITPGEAKAMFPLMDESHFVGALWDPVEGHLDPSGTTHAYAKAARALGASVVLRNRVLELNPTADGGWDVVTEQGTVTCEHVVNAGGLWAREVGRMAGIELPVLAMEHMYLLTEPMPEVAEFNASTGRELVGAIDFKAEIYTRQERGGLLLGTYEKDCRPWSPVETPWDFGHELLPEDLERIAPSLEMGSAHFPAFAEAGIRQTINGPFTFAPDGNPLVGPVQGLRNFWSACGVMAGFSQGGGVGLVLANWIVDGDPGHDVFGMDVARYGDFTTLRYTRAKVRENYSRRFSIRFPNEELPAGRPQQTTPLYDIMVRDKRAVMGDTWGLEVPLWFAPEGVEPIDELSFHRSNDFDAIAAEVRGVREAVGVTEIANFAKYRVTGAGAEAWLSSLMTNVMPRPGRLVLTPMLNERGKLIGDFTVARTDHGTAQAPWPERTTARAPPRTPTSWSGARRARRSTTSAGSSDTCPPTARCTSSGSASGWSGSRSPVLARASCSPPSSTCRSTASPSASWIIARWTSAPAPASSTASATPGISATRSGPSRPTSATSTPRSSARVRRSGSSTSACGRCCRCAWRRGFPPGSRSFARSTVRARRTWPASSSSTRATSSAARRRSWSARRGHACNA